MATDRDCRPLFLAGWLLTVVAVSSGCGGGGGGSSSPPPPVVIPSLNSVRLSGASPFASGCDRVVSAGTSYENAEVEPSVASRPADPTHLVAAWQQDRWSDGGSHGLLAASSSDAGQTWSVSMPSFSRCAGGTAATGTDYERASDPWLTVAADGTVYMLSLSFSGNTFAAGSSSGMLAARSTDGGATWGVPTVLIADGSAFFDDKGSITADPQDSRFVYAVWDRLTTTNTGPTYFARTTDSGTSWEAARSIFDPGANNQTIGNIIACLPDGSLLLVFSEFDSQGATVSAAIKTMRSTDHGATWAAPVLVAAEQPVGTHDPLTGATVRDGSDLPSIAVGPDGHVHIAWQDSRFSSGQRNGIAFSSSSDNGATWSAPVQVNGARGAQAFVPTVSVRGDGVIGVAYYDFRNDQRQSGQLTTDYWLATSTEGVTWHDTHVKGPFSLLGAPVAEGLFLGDYQALVASASDFLPVFVTATNDTANPTDAFIAFGSVAATASAIGQPSMLDARVGPAPSIVKISRPTASSRADRLRTSY